MVLRYLLTAGLLLLLGSCGFHLRGAEPLPEVMGKTTIVVPAGSALRYELESLLLSAGAEVVDEKSDATALLTVHSDHVRSRILSVDALGRAREYALSLTVKYSLNAAGGEILAQQLSSRVERDYHFDPDSVLAQGGEREMVEQEMRRVAAQQILRRLRTITFSPGSLDSVPVTESDPAQ
ncbi:MAG: LPS assembly lipoprotein LptE [Pseudomonadota bacterium]